MRQIEQAQGLVGEWINVTDAMHVLADQTKGVEPKYFYLELHRRIDRCSMALRWRSVGRGGSSFQFADPRMQKVLGHVPVAMRRQYERWECEKEILNTQAKKLRLALGDRVTDQRLKQKLLGL